MVVGVLTMAVVIHDSRSLKAKRAVLRRLKDRVRNTFNVGIAEVGAHDRWQDAQIGIVVVGTDRRHLNSTLDAVLNFIDRLGIVEIRDHNIDLMSGWEFP